MDAETAEKLAALEAKIGDLARQLDAVLNPPARGRVLTLQQAAHRSGFSIETMRRRAIAGAIPGACKRGGRWVFEE
jgi:hypothetical protein